MHLPGHVRRQRWAGAATAIGSLVVGAVGCVVPMSAADPSLMASLVGPTLAGIGLNLFSVATERRLRSAADAWIRDGRTNEDLQAALVRAYVKAVERSRREYFETEDAHRLSGADRDAAKELFEALIEQADGAFLGEAVELSDEDLRDFAGGSGEAVPRRILERIGEEHAVPGVDVHVREHLVRTLPSRTAANFIEEMKNPSEDGTKAWRAYERLMLVALRDQVAKVETLQKEAAEQLRRLDGRLDRLWQMPPTTYDEESEAARRAVLDRSAERVSSLLTRFERAVQGALGELRAAADRFDATADRMDGAVQKFEALVERLGAKTALRSLMPGDGAWGGYEFLAILRACNAAALALLAPPADAGPPAAGVPLVPPLLREDLYDQRHWIEVYVSKDREPAVARILRTLDPVRGVREAAGPRRDRTTGATADEGPMARLWIVGPAGSGKTTLLHQSYLRYLAQRRAAAREQHAPEPMLIRPRNIGLTQAADVDTRSREGFLRRLLKAWLANRGLEPTDDEVAVLTLQLIEALAAGRVVPFVDGYDELGRLDLQAAVSDHLFVGTGCHFVCASRPEAFTRSAGGAELWLEDVWDTATADRYLRARLGASADRAQALLAYIGRRGHGHWLRNPRHLSLLVDNIHASGPTEAAAGEAGAALAAAAEEGEYALLDELISRSVRRLRALDGERVPAAELERAVRQRLVALAVAQLRDGTYDAEAALRAGDAYWTLLLGATELLDVRVETGGRRLFLRNATLVDFFLARRIADELSRDAARSPDVPLSLAGHLWSRSLVQYVGELLTGGAGRGASPSSPATRVRRALEGSARFEGPVPDTLWYRPEAGREGERFRAVNLLHLAVWLAAHARGGSGPGDSASAGPIRGPRAVLRGLQLQDLNLEGVDLHRVRLDLCEFDGSVLADARLAHAVFEECTFRGANFHGAEATSAHFERCTFDFHERVAIPSAVQDMVVQGCTAGGSDADALLAAFQRGGAVLHRSRYLGPFGRHFLSRQSDFLGPHLEEARGAYVGRIRTFLDGDEGRGRASRRFAIDLMAGGASSGSRDLVVARESADAAPPPYPDLHLLAVDRDPTSLARLAAEAGSRIAVAPVEIGRGVDLRALLRTYFDASLGEADLVIGKKAIHEVDALTQISLLKACAEVLRPGGMVVLHADAPPSMSRTGYRRLQRLLSPIRSGGGVVELLESAYLGDLFPDPTTEDDRAVFMNLWILLKDWANRNTQEVQSRYFSSATEIDRWARHAGLEPAGAPLRQRFTVCPQRFNEVGYDRAAQYLSRRPGELTDDESGEVMRLLVGGDAHDLLCRFTERQLWRAEHGEPTALGRGMRVRQKPVTARELAWIDERIAALPLPPSYETALSFDLDAHILAFRKPGAPTARA
jgi:SAM-dependent methyltransferase